MISETFTPASNVTMSPAYCPAAADHCSPHEMERIATLEASERNQAQPQAQWVLLWSQSQCAFHVERMDDMLTQNRLAYRDDHRSDYVPLVIADRCLVEEAVAALRGTLAARQQERVPELMQ